MKKDNKKVFIEDFNNAYTYKPDKDKIFNSLGIERKQEETCPIFFKKLSRVFISLSIVLSCLLIGMASHLTYNEVKLTGNEIVTEEFKDFMNEYTEERNGKVYFGVSIEDKVDIYIYRSLSVDTKEYYYFYIIKCNKEIKDCRLITDKEIKVSNNSYGILSIKTENDLSEPIIFSIEIDKKVSEFKIN